MHSHIFVTTCCVNLDSKQPSSLGVQWFKRVADWALSCKLPSFYLPSPPQWSDEIHSFESSGTANKNLTFSEFCGTSYAGVSDRFTEYLKLCYRMSPLLNAASCPLTRFPLQRRNGGGNTLWVLFWTWRTLPLKSLVHFWDLLNLCAHQQLKPLVLPRQ